MIAPTAREAVHTLIDLLHCYEPHIKDGEACTQLRAYRDLCREYCASPAALADVAPGGTSFVDAVELQAAVLVRFQDDPKIMALINAARSLVYGLRVKARGLGVNV